MKRSFYMLYRIFTENKNLKKIEKVVGGFFEGFTLIKSEGFWRLQKENSLIIEIVIPPNDEKISELARLIKQENNQETVLIQRINNNQWFV